MVTVDDVLASIKSRTRNPEQEARIRALYTRAHDGFQVSRGQGVKAVLDSDWKELKAKFDKALETVEKDTGLF